jgi:hypothetical protein
VRSLADQPVKGESGAERLRAGSRPGLLPASGVNPEQWLRPEAELVTLRTETQMKIDEFKTGVAEKTVRDEPWDTQLVWADAATDLDDLDEAGRDAAVSDVLVELFDDGLVEYFVVTSYSPQVYEREPAPSEFLTREELREHLNNGEQTLRLRPTEAARMRYAPGAR